MWEAADVKSPEFGQIGRALSRLRLDDTLIGKLPEPTMPPNVRTRKILEEPAFTGYEVMIDVYPDVVAGGILLLPKGSAAVGKAARGRLPARSRRRADGHDQQDVRDGYPILQGFHRGVGQARLHYLRAAEPVSRR